MRPLAPKAQALPPRAVLPLAALLLSACAGLSPATGQPDLEPKTRLAAVAAPQWLAPVPHNALTTDLRNWWSTLDDPVLVDLISAAQTASPTLASARSRIEQARGTQTISRAALQPTLDASLGASRGVTQPNSPAANTLQGAVVAGWEIDLFGANRQATNAASERLESANAQWHDARVSVAAEVATLYVDLRACELQLALGSSDAASRAETARLSALSTKAGFTAPAIDALARASAAEAVNRSDQQRAQCAVGVKGMVALTDLAEPALRQKLAAPVSPNAYKTTFAIAAVPAQALAQRPDLASAQRDLAAASFDIGTSEAQRYPRLSLSGSIGALSVASGGVSSDLTTWSIGPLALSMPLWDSGKRAANLASAKARYAESEALYRARMRQAVREVEVALVNLQSADVRKTNTQVAAAGYRASFQGTQARFKAGLAGLPELEESRRTALNADTALLFLERDRMLAWISLYRSVGGGWTLTDTVPEVLAAEATKTVTTSSKP